MTHHPDFHRHLVHLVRHPRNDGADGRREPVLERKRLAPVASGQAVFGQLEEAEVAPRNGEAELDEHVGGRGEDDGEDVGEEEVQAGQGLYN